MPDRGRTENTVDGNRSGEGEDRDGGNSWSVPYANAFLQKVAQTSERTSLENGVTFIKEGGRTAVEFPFGTKLIVDLNFDPPVMAEEKGTLVPAKQTSTLLSMPPANVFAFKNGGRLIAYENGWGSFSFAGDAGTAIEYDLNGVRSVTHNGKTVVLRQDRQVLPFRPPLPPNREYTI